MLGTPGNARPSTVDYLPRRFVVVVVVVVVRGRSGGGGATRAGAAQRQHHDARNGAGKGNAEEQRAAVLREKERSRTGKPATWIRWERNGREREEIQLGRAEERAARLAQKRANVDEIGGGSLQLLAGMSGNAWDSILKAQPRQSPLPPVPSSPSVLPSTATP